MALMLSEARSGGWSGTVNVDPQLASPKMRSIPYWRMGSPRRRGSRQADCLRQHGTYRYHRADLAVHRHVGEHHALEHTYSNTHGGRRRAFCGITFRDPLSFYRHRPLWTAFAKCSLSEILGGALSARRAGRQAYAHAGAAGDVGGTHRGATAEGDPQHPLRNRGRRAAWVLAEPRLRPTRSANSDARRIEHRATRNRSVRCEALRERTEPRRRGEYDGQAERRAERHESHDRRAGSQRAAP